MDLEIRLYATLRTFAPSSATAGVFFIKVPEEITVGELLTHVGIPAKLVHMKMVNGVGVSDDRVLKTQDRVGLFPPIGGG